MTTPEKTITSIPDLIAATKDETVRHIVIDGALTGAPSLRLLPGQSLHGDEEGAGISFVDGSDGLQLSADNLVQNIHLHTAPDSRALFNDTSVSTLGQIRLEDITTIGRVQILARDSVRAGHIEIDGLDIAAADARGETERPHGFGVYVLQGAFTLWNMQPDADVMLSANLVGLCAGRPGAPVRGSGIFVSGAGDTGGRLHVERLETGAVYSDGAIAPGTADLISGGVFTVYGVYADRVQNHGPVVTTGVNDMVLDNWGAVDRWTAEEKITSFGASGIGFVNFGSVNALIVNAPIETFGQGARGFNVYAGRVHTAEFDRVVTHGDGAVGIQISQPIGRLVVHRGIETFGGTGPSLVKGVVVELSAIGLSVKPGGTAREIEVAGGIWTNGAGVAPVELLGAVESFRVVGGLVAASPKSE
ncbi:MAG TPA: hypothetical protein VL026_12595 [Rhizomicrobium sp.]|nr:hypothetical protein [Rhizomicrobium sp.]